MNWFQIVSVTVLAGLILRDLLVWQRGRERRALLAARLFTWSAAVVAISHPEYTQMLAKWSGITRGADVVLYGFVLVFLVVLFAMYGWNVRLERQLTLVVRHLALRDARQGPLIPPDAPPDAKRVG